MLRLGPGMPPGAAGPAGGPPPPDAGAPPVGPDAGPGGPPPGAGAPDAGPQGMGPDQKLDLILLGLHHIITLLSAKDEGSPDEEAGEAPDDEAEGEPPVPPKGA